MILSLADGGFTRGLAADRDVSMVEIFPEVFYSRFVRICLECFRFDCGEGEKIGMGGVFG